MKIVELIRLEGSRNGTLGALKINKQVFCWTMEPPNLLNALHQSAIPAQQYICVPFESASFGRTHIVTNVPGRSSILFHPGNTVEDTTGCILLGLALGSFNGKRALLNSRSALASFKEAVGADSSFHLTISERY